MTQLAKNLPANVGDLDSILGEGKGYPLQYSDLENYIQSVGVTKSRT